MAAAAPVARADADDVAAQAHDLYTRFGSQIQAYCMARLRSREEAEDAVQTTFMNAFRALKRGTATRAEQAWLFKIAQNVCLARQTSTTRRLRVEKPDDLETLQQIVPAPSWGRADELIGLEDVLATMPENQRRAILLREWQGLSYREIAGELDLSQAAVEMLIFRARRALARGLEQQHHQPAPRAERRVGRRLGQGLDLGGIVAALKSLLAGGAAVKTLAIAVAAGTVAGTTTVERHRPFAPPLRSTPASPAPSLRTPPAPRASTVTAAAPTTDGTKLPARRRPAPRSVPAGAFAPPARHDAGVDPVVPASTPSAQAPQATNAPAPHATAPAPQAASAPAPKTTAPAPPAAAPVDAAAPGAPQALAADAPRRAGSPPVEPLPPAAAHAPGRGRARGQHRGHLKVPHEPAGRAPVDPAARRPHAEGPGATGTRAAAVDGRPGRDGGANDGGLHGRGSMQPLAAIAPSVSSTPAPPPPVVEAEPTTVPPAGAVPAPPPVAVETATVGPRPAGNEHARDGNGAPGGNGNGHGNAYDNTHGNGNGNGKRR